MAIPQVIDMSQVNAASVVANSLLFSNGVNPNGIANIVYDQVNNYLNVAANVVMNGVFVAAPNTFLVNSNTRIETGLAANMVANIQTTATITSANILPVFFNETGMYTFDGIIFIGAAVGAGVNAANIGVNIAFLNSATATINTIRLAMTTRTNGNTFVVNVVSTNAQTVCLPVSGGTQTGSLSTPAAASISNDYIDIQGLITVNATGMAQTMICAANNANNNLLIWANSFIVYTKIG